MTAQPASTRVTTLLSSSGSASYFIASAVDRSAWRFMTILWYFLMVLL